VLERRRVRGQRAQDRCALPWCRLFPDHGGHANTGPSVDRPRDPSAVNSKETAHRPRSVR
jgi:hypothetical protein